MKTLIVYDSVFGNTEKLAVAMGGALDAKAIRAQDIRPGDLDELTLLIAGSPTRGFKPTPAVTAWIKELPAGSLSGVNVAAFDTRIDPGTIKSGLLKKMMTWFGYAAEPIAKGLVKKGGRLAAAPEGFFVSASEGPLGDEETKRASDWAAGLTSV